MNLYVCIKDYQYRISGDEYQRILKGSLFAVNDPKNLPGLSRSENRGKEYEYFYQLNIGSCEGVGYIQNIPDSIKKIRNIEDF